ncbi:MAG: hypothetical protein Q9223_003933 [Gallowayella weberi]
MGRRLANLLPPKHPRTGQRDFSGTRSNSSAGATAGPSSSSTAPQDESDTTDTEDTPSTGFPEIHKDNPYRPKKDDNKVPAWAPGYVPPVASAGTGPAPTPAKPARWIYPSKDGDDAPAWAPGHDPTVPALATSVGIAATVAFLVPIHRPSDTPATLGVSAPSLKPPPTHLLAPREWMLHGERINKLLWWAYSESARWALLVGAYFQTGDRSPSDLGRLWEHASPLNEFRRNWRLLDELNARGASLSPFALPNEDVETLHNMSWEEREVFEEAISRWARDPDHNNLIRETLKAAFWIDQSLPSGWPHDENWHIMDTIFKLPEVPEKVAKMSQAKLESPLFFAACMKDSFCGL